MVDIFKSAKRRVARARTHVAELESRSGSFFGTRPYIRLVERNPDGFDEHKVKLIRTIPDEITDLAYEAIEALRSSLDQVIHPIALAYNLKRPDHIHFPITDDVITYEKALKYFRDCPIEIQELLSSFKAYKGANDVIWSLNQIRRQSSHRLIIPVGITNGGVYIKSLATNGWKGGIRTPSPLWNTEKEEIILVIAGAGTEINYEIALYFYLAFGQVDGLANQPVINCLNAMVIQVDTIVLAVESLARKLRVSL